MEGLSIATMMLLIAMIVAVPPVGEVSAATVDRLAGSDR